MPAVRRGYVCGFLATSIALGERPYLKRIRLKVIEQGTMSSSGLYAGVGSSGHAMHTCTGTRMYTHLDPDVVYLRYWSPLPARSPSSWLKAF